MLQTSGSSCEQVIELEKDRVYRPAPEALAFLSLPLPSDRCEPTYSELDYMTVLILSTEMLRAQGILSSISRPAEGARRRPASQERASITSKRPRVDDNDSFNGDVTDVKQEQLDAMRVSLCPWYLSWL